VRATKRITAIEDRMMKNFVLIVKNQEIQTKTIEQLTLRVLFLEKFTVSLFFFFIGSVILKFIYEAWI
jgi:hypothetical protein